MQSIGNQIQGYTSPQGQVYTNYDQSGKTFGKNEAPSVRHQAKSVSLVGSQINTSGNFITPSENRLNKLKEQFDEKALKGMGVIECATCASRTYQDGSNDPGVSFKSPQHISPEISGSVVMGHEMEHVSREGSNAEMHDREVVSQSVQLFTAVCPECGKSYVSGGVTKTTTAAKKANENTSLLANYGKAKQINTKGNLLDITL